MMKAEYTRPTTSVRTVYTEMFCASLTGDDKVDVSDASGLLQDQSITEDETEIWYGDVKAQHSWGDDPF